MKKNTLLILLLSTCYFLAFGQGYFEVANLTAFDLSGNDRFGYSVDHSPSHAIFGAVNQDKDANGSNHLKNAGAAYIFALGGGVQKIVPSDRSTLDRFGFSVAIEGNYAVIGTSSQGGDFNRKAYVFKLASSGIWEEQQLLTTPEASSSTLFGYSVAISNGTIIVGDPSNDLDENGMNNIGDVGAAYIFEMDGSGAWVETQKLVPDNRFTNSAFGFSVAIDNDQLVIGARTDRRDENDDNVLKNAGAGFIFHKDISGAWLQKQKVVASDRAAGQYFGEDVSISGENIIFGAPREKRDADGLNSMKNAGAVYAFNYDSASDEWSEIQKVTAQNRALNSRYGRSVDINNDRFVSGSAFGPTAEVELFFDSGLGDWSFNQSLVASDYENGDFFSIDVSVDESFIMSGAMRNNILQADGSIVKNAGSGYVYYNLPCDLPSIINIDLSVNCGTGMADISVDGALNGATHWAVYTGDCGNTLIGSGFANNFSVSIPPGTTAIFIRGEDGAGCINENAGICFNMTIGPLVDSAPPVAICQDITVYLDNAGMASIVAGDIDGGSYDDCGNVNMAAGPLNFDCDDIGDNTATLQIWDDSGNGAFCNATVTVEDAMNLVVACQDITISLDAAGNASITEADIDGGTYDNCHPVFMAAAPKNFDASNVGDNTVWLQVWTNFGESGYCTANVHVVNPFAMIANNQDDLPSMTLHNQIPELPKSEIIKEVSEANDIKLYPNPAVSEFTLSSPSRYPIQKIMIMNSNSSKIQAFEYGDEQRSRTINVEELSQGIYFIVIHSETETQVKKLIKI